MPERETVIDSIRVPNEWVRENLPHITSPKNLRIITGYGDSMLETYNHGDPLIVDIGVLEMRIDAIYVFALHNELYIKRIQRLPGGAIKVISDNRAKYDPFTVRRRTARHPHPGARGVRLESAETMKLQEVGHVQVFNFGSTALLRYSVNGTQVQKSIVRQTWRRNALSGSYVGAFIGTYSAGCQAVGYAEEPFTGSVGESAESITLIGTTSLGACTYTGPYVQRGRFGEVVGTFQCTNGEAGQFRAYEIDGSRAGFSAQATITAGAGCSWAGHFGGLRRQ
jgi:hypothetical protein